MLKKAKFFVRDIKKETADTVTVFVYSENIEFSFIAGQYVMVYFDDDKKSQGKFYTISSSPDEKFLAISVKKMGPFSSLFHNLKIGDFVYISGPFGNFYPSDGARHLVFLSAGIGITPFFSIMKDYNEKGIHKKIDLFYTNKTFESIVFYKNINDICKKNPNIKTYYFLTRENDKKIIVDRHGRMDTGFINEKLGDLSEKSFYICGPSDFVSGMKKQLLGANVSKDKIFTEKFF